MKQSYPVGSRYNSFGCLSIRMFFVKISTLILLGTA